MAWQQVSATVAAAQVEQAVACFEAAGAMSVTCQDAADQPLLEPLPGETPVWDSTRVVALFGEHEDPGPVIRAAASALGLDRQAFTVVELADRDWSSTWRDSFSAMRFGERLWICPSDEDCPDPGASVVHLDPGLAFGTGTHATTAMCLAWLDQHPPAGRTVIDYGCGSGILALAACALGAARVIACDLDPQALQATRENARRNGMGGRLLEIVAPENVPDIEADLVLANILARPLCELVERLTGLLKPGGSIVMTGILTGQVDEVMAAYHDVVALGPPVASAEWVLLAGTKTFRPGAGSRYS